MSSPASNQAAIARDVLERMMLEMRRLPGFIDRRTISKAMEAAMMSLVRLIDHPVDAPDHLDLLTDAQKRVKYAREVVHDQVIGTPAERYVRGIKGVEAALDASRDATIDVVVQRQQDLAGAPVEAAQAFDGGPFAGSLGSPRLHRIAREPLQTLVDTEALQNVANWEDVLPEEEKAGEEGLDLADDFDPRDHEWEGLVPLKHDRDGLRQLQLVTERGAPDELPETVPGIDGEVAFAQRQLRDCLEELGNLGNLRVLKPAERFDEGTIAFESRMLENLDAAVALAQPFYLGVGGNARFRGLDILEETVSYSRGSFTADPVRTYARAFVLGCVEGEDTVRAAVLALRQSSPYTHAAQTEALSLGTNPAIVPAMVRLCRVDDDAMTGVALDVLLKRNQVDFAAVIPLLEHPNDAIRARAARCLGLVAEREAALLQLGELLETDLEDAVVCAAAEGMILQGSARGLEAVRERMTEELDDPGIIAEPSRLHMMRILAIGGNAADAKLLGEHYHKDQDEVEALGWHGSAHHVEPLILTLEDHHAGRITHAYAARALHRITGAGIREAVQETDADFYALSTVASEWRQWWTENASRFDMTTKYRFGLPYTPEMTLAELARMNVPQLVRDRLAFELAIATGELVNIRDWAVNQFAAFERIQSELDPKAHKEGRYLS